MEKQWVFDTREARRISLSRKDFLDKFLQRSSINFGLTTVLDVGCGIGFFSGHLVKYGLKVTAFDGRPENVDEAKSRYSEVEFHVQDVENSQVRELGSFDLVLCYGLLYHLENPFKAIRNLYALTGKIMLVESLVVPHQAPVAILKGESQDEDQALRQVVFVPSEACLVKMFYRAGFRNVYRATELPDHEDFRETFGYKRRRVVLVASKIDLASRLLQRVPEPQVGDLWRKSWGNRVEFFRRSRGKLLAKLWAGRNKFVPQLPLPGYLPWGAWWLAWNDAMGRHIWFRDAFEEGERNFLFGFLKAGMVVLDIGAHQGFYSLLAAQRVGSSGRVVAFEPSPRELRRLRWNLVLNRYRNVYVEPLALSSFDGTAELFVCLGEETGCNSLCPPAVSEPTARVPVQVVTLDGYLREHSISNIDVVKLDVEGAEISVLKGATKLLNSISRPVILCELADVRTVPWGYPAREIYEFLESFNYRWFSVLPEGRLQACKRKKRYHENLIALPAEKIATATDFINGRWK